MSKNQSAFIKLKRTNKLLGWALKHKVIIDSEVVHKIKSNETVTIEVRPGKHIIQTKVYNDISNELAVVLGPGEEINLLCGVKEGLDYLSSLFSKEQLFVKPFHEPASIPQETGSENPQDNDQSNAPQTEHHQLYQEPKISPNGRNKIFISYRREDSADATGRIYDRLIKHFGKEAIFKDVDSIPLGIDFKEHLDSMVGKCEILLAVIGKDWLNMKDANGKRLLDKQGDYVRIEIESALKRRIPVVPLLVRNASIPPEDSLPSTLKGLSFRNGTAVRSDPDFHNDMDRLIEGLESHL